MIFGRIIDTFILDAVVFDLTIQRICKKSKILCCLKNNILPFLADFQIDFMKDRVMAEQFAKDRMEELYQAEIESLGEEISELFV